MIKKVALVHVPYGVRGGEEVHLETLEKVYKSMGLEVSYFPRDRSPPGLSAPLKAWRSLSLSDDFGDFKKEFEKEKPDFIHLHNPYPVLGPRFLHYILESKIPMIHTVHNHRFFCTNGLALRNGKTCRLCLPSAENFWKPFLFNCNDSLLKSAYYASALSRIRKKNWLSDATRFFIVPSPHLAALLQESGVPLSKIKIIPHPVSVPRSPNLHGVEIEVPNVHDIFYGGRLSYEKGIHLILEAANLLPEVKFAIAGSGPLQALVERRAGELPNLKYFGSMTREEALKELESSRYAIFPTICDESFGQSAIESFLLNRPCFISNRPSLQWMAFPPHSPIWFESGNLESMVSTIETELTRSTYLRNTLFQRARECEKLYGVERYALDLKASLQAYL